MKNAGAVDARAAIEALRAGVPNRTAIRLLGTTETALRDDVLDGLRQCRSALRDGRSVEGVLFAGAFGAGKSHQLGCFAELARQENFIVSQVPISKETPLFDPAKVFAAAIRAAVVPGANDDVMTAVLGRLEPSRDAYETLMHWTAAEVRAGLLSPLFAALLRLVPLSTLDPDARARMARFFGGAKLNASLVKNWLREAGAAKDFDIKPVREADLALQRLKFAPRLFRAAGYEGWCILLDEVELIGRYSPLQRGRSYAELARWLGLDRGESVAGIVVVAAVTDDFADEMFAARHDDEQIPRRLEQRGPARQAAMARSGIARLARREPRLTPPSEDALQRSLASIRALYGDAYDWTPPADIGVGERLAGKSMRQYVKSWITTWDIARLYGEMRHIETATILIDYTESSEIEQATASADEDDSEGHGRDTNGNAAQTW